MRAETRAGGGDSPLLRSQAGHTCSTSHSSGRVKPATGYRACSRDRL